MSAIRVLVDLRKIEGENGTGQVVFTYKCAKPIRTRIPDIVTYFETEKKPYHSYNEGEEIVQEHLKYLHRS